MSGPIAVDIGTSRTLVADPSGRIVFDEPTVAAVDLRSAELICFGSAALGMAGRVAGDVAIVRPVAHGQLQDLALTDQMVAALLRRVRPKAGRHPEVLCAVAGLATGVQRRALERSFKKAGAGHVDFIEHAFAAGLGLRLHIEEPVASMVVDAGGGTTDVAVMALGGVVTEASVPLGGEDLDRAVRELCLRSFDLVISPAAAEQVKIDIGTAWPTTEEKIEIAGRDVSNGMQRTVVLSSSEVSGALADPLRTMIAAAVDCIVTSPPDLANDLLSRGLHLCGEGALLTGYARKLATATGIPVHLARAPGRSAVLGAAVCLSDLQRRAATAAVNRAEAEPR